MGYGLGLLSFGDMTEMSLVSSAFSSLDMVLREKFSLPESNYRLTDLPKGARSAISFSI